MKVVLLDVWAKRGVGAMITMVALLINFAMPIAGHATSGVQQAQPALTNQNVNVNQNVNQQSQRQSIKVQNPESNSSRALPNTGAGNLIGLFVLASLAGTLGYRRRLLSHHAA